MEKNRRRRVFKRLVYGCCIAAFVGLAAFSSINSAEQKAELNPQKEILINKYYYAHWTISKNQYIPYIVIPESIGDYSDMEDQFEYFVGKNDRSGRLIMSERWVRNRVDMPFPLPDIKLEINQRRYFKILDDNTIEEIDYQETEGNSRYVVGYKFKSTFPGREGVAETYNLVTQYMRSKEEYIYKGEERNASESIKHQVDSRSN